MSAPELLAELKSRGIRLTARGDRLAYDAPAGAMTPDLAERVRRYKPELLALLDPPPTIEPETHADRETRRFMRAAVPWPDGRGWYDPGQRQAVHALGRAERTPQAPAQASPPTADIPAGWTAGAWARELRRLADACDMIRPDLAAEYREQAGRCSRLTTTTRKGRV